MPTFRSKQLSVEAMQVTIDSLHEAAQWVGTYRSQEGIYVVVPVPGDRAAHLDEWIVKEGNKFKVLTNDEFRQTYNEG